MGNCVTVVVLNVVRLPSLVVALALFTLAQVHYHVLLLVMHVSNMVSFRDVRDL